MPSSNLHAQVPMAFGLTALASFVGSALIVPTLRLDPKAQQRLLASLLRVLLVRSKPPPIIAKGFQRLVKPKPEERKTFFEGGNEAESLEPAALVMVCKGVCVGFFVQPIKGAARNHGRDEGKKGT